MDIEYDQIKYEIKMMEFAEYKNATRRNVMNVDDIEDFANFRVIDIFLKSAKKQLF